MCKKDRSRCLEAGIITVEATDNIKELTKLYSGADVFVNTTYEDNFPTVNIEALSCGTPVITYATGGSPECLNNDVGVSVPVGDIDKLAKAVKEFKCNRDKCMQKGRTYSVNNFVKSYLNIYKEILN